MDLNELELLNDKEELIELIRTIEKKVVVSYETAMLKNKLKGSLKGNISCNDISHLIYDSITLINDFEKVYEYEKRTLFLQAIRSNKIYVKYTNLNSKELKSELKLFQENIQKVMPKIIKTVDNNSEKTQLQKKQVYSKEYLSARDQIANPKKYWEEFYDAQSKQAFEKFSKDPGYIDFRCVKFIVYKYPISKLPISNWGYISYDKKKKTSKKYYFALLKRNSQSSFGHFSTEVIICKQMYELLSRKGVRKRNILDLFLDEVFKVNQT